MYCSSKEVDDAVGCCVKVFIIGTVPGLSDIEVTLNELMKEKSVLDDRISGLVMRSR